MTLIDFHNKIASIIRPGFESNLNYIKCQDELDYHLFPSVNRGSMSIEKLKNLLNFQPTNIQEAFEETVKFYEKARFIHLKERIRIEKELKKNFKHEAAKLSEFANLFNKS